MAVLITSSKFSARDANGAPLAGGKVNTYLAGTLTRQATYTNQGGGTPNANPVILDSSGRANIWLDPALTYRFIVTDSADVMMPDGDVDNISAAVSLIDLTSMAINKGAALVGSNDAANYFNGATVEAILQEIGNSRGQFQVDGVNALRYIAPSLWANILNGSSAVDLAVQLQAAMTAEPNLIFPDGLFNTSVKLIPRVDSKIRGINRRGARIKGTAAITILECPINNFDLVIENIRFMGTGATGISMAATAGTLQGYLIRPHIQFCDFDYDLAYGINADLIFATIEKNTFGYYGVAAAPAPGASTFVAIKSFQYPATSNDTNLNVVRNNIFQRCGSLTVPGVDLSSGSAWLFDSNDFEQGGFVLRTSNIQLLKFTGSNWVEGNVATNALFSFGASTTPVLIDGIQVRNNTCDRIFEAPLDGTCKGIVIKNCDLGLVSPSYVLFDTISLARLLPGNGSVSFYDNHVSGGNASNKIVTGTDFRGGPTSARIVAIVDTTGAGTLTYCSDPGATLVRNGVGDVTLTTISHPLASATSKVMAFATPQSATECRCLVTNTSSVRVQAFTSAGAAADGVISIEVKGA